MENEQRRLGTHIALRYIFSILTGVRRDSGAARHPDGSLVRPAALENRRVRLFTGVRFQPGKAQQGDAAAHVHGHRGICLISSPHHRMVSAQAGTAPLVAPMSQNQPLRTPTNVSTSRLRLPRGSANSRYSLVFTGANVLHVKRRLCWSFWDCLSWRMMPSVTARHDACLEFGRANGAWNSRQAAIIPNAAPGAPTSPASLCGRLQLSFKHVQVESALGMAPGLRRAAWPAHQQTCSTCEMRGCC